MFHKVIDTALQPHRFILDHWPVTESLVREARPPLEAELRLAYVWLLGLAPVGSNAEARAEWARVQLAMNELAKWISPPMSEEQIEALKEEIAESMLNPKRQFTVADAARIAARACGRRGRPATKRHLAVKAFDMWLARPRKSWMQVTREVCNCGKASHDPRCKDQLLQQVKDLKKVLKKFNIPIPQRCGSLNKK